MSRYPQRRVAQRQQDIFVEQIGENYDEDHGNEGDVEANEEHNKSNKKDKCVEGEIEMEPTFVSGALTSASNMKGVLQYYKKSHNKNGYGEPTTFGRCILF